MKAVVFLFCFLSCQSVRAGSFLGPESVLSVAIASANSGRDSHFERCCDLPSIATDPRNPTSPDAFLALLRTIDYKQAKFESGPVVTGAFGHLRVTIRMVSPQRLDFDLAGSPEINGILWRIVAVH